MVVFDRHTEYIDHLRTKSEFLGHGQLHLFFHEYLVDDVDLGLNRQWHSFLKTVSSIWWYRFLKVLAICWAHFDGFGCPSSLYLLNGLIKFILSHAPCV